MSDSLLDLTVVECWGCRARIDSRDNYCRRCGQGQGPCVSWYYRPFGIVVSTVLGLGPLGLILVWKAPLSRAWRAALAVFVLGFSAVLAHGAIQLIRQVSAAWGMIRSALYLGGAGF